MKSYIIYFILLPFLISSSCEKDIIPNDLNNPIYFNSFETSSDTIGWKGYGQISLYNDAPKTGGKKSLFVSGGCVIPHAIYNVGPQTDECYIILKCWGKNLEVGGSIYLKPDNGYRSISISVTGKNWTVYESQDTLFCPANESLILELISGGIMSSAMLVDLLEIRKAK